MARKPEDTSFTDMFAAFGRNLKIPSVDVDAVVEHNRRNLEALQKSVTASATGANEAMARHRDMLQAQMREIGDMAQNYRMGSAPHEAFEQHAAAVRKSFETAVKNAGEVAQIMQKSSAESVEILRQRIRESMDEIRQTFEKGK
ncbi:MAG: TIGR01841 family phasin [Rhizobiaceae bacterium]|nr:TIGR01841 family phasin [Rhizobiaceae bacterium]